VLTIDHFYGKASRKYVYIIITRWNIWTSRYCLSHFIIYSNIGCIVMSLTTNNV